MAAVALGGCSGNAVDDAVETPPSATASTSSGSTPAGPGPQAEIYSLVADADPGAASHQQELTTAITALTDIAGNDSARQDPQLIAANVSTFIDNVELLTGTELSAGQLRTLKSGILRALGQ